MKLPEKINNLIEVNLAIDRRNFLKICAIFTSLTSAGCNKSPENAGNTQEGVTATVIIEQPQDQTIKLGEKARFSVSAEGTMPLLYQWQKEDVDVKGAIDSIYVTDNLSLDDLNKSYRVRITNSVTTVYSNSAYVLFDFADITADSVLVSIDTTQIRL